MQGDDRYGSGVDKSLATGTSGYLRCDVDFGNMRKLKVEVQAPRVAGSIATVDRCSVKGSLSSFHTSNCSL